MVLSGTTSAGCSPPALVDSSDAIAQLNRALPHLRRSEPKRAAMALETIATAYRADNQYGDAVRAYAELSDQFADQLDHFPADDAALARILSGTSPQTIVWQGAVKLKTSNNPIGSRSPSSWSMAYVGPGFLMRARTSRWSAVRVPEILAPFLPKILTLPLPEMRAVLS
jgi:hypothetical protein